MPFTVKNLHQVVRPWRLFVVVLASVFAIESLVMLVLPWLLPEPGSYLGEAFADALILTVFFAPLLWRFIVHPLESLLELRTKLLRRLLTLQEDERGRIARDLHDGLGQSLTCLLVGLRTAQELTTEENVCDHLQELRRIGGSLHDELRRLSRGLRPAVLDDLGLSAALDQLCRDATTSSGRNVSATIRDNTLQRLPPPVETNCFRIVQEALANALRHSRVGPISVLVLINPEVVSLVICNAAEDAPEAPPQQDSSADSDFTSSPLVNGRSSRETFRIWTIRERVSLLGGAVEVDSRADGSTCVTCRIPTAFQGET